MSTIYVYLSFGGFKMADRRGRPLGSTNRVNKKQATMSMTPEAWAIVQKHCDDLSVNKSDYIESLVRRGDLATYDLTITYLVQHLERLESRLRQIDRTRDDLQVDIDSIREFLRKIGLSPKLMP
ncbi:MAG: hypothetical protein AB4372_32475 [Xenococcus sp. (in: cyanobacteria)]